MPFAAERETAAIEFMPPDEINRDRNNKEKQETRYNQCGGLGINAED